MVGVTFLLLAAWVTYESIESLVLHEAPSASWPGIAIAGLSHGEQAVARASEATGGRLTREPGAA